MQALLGTQVQVADDNAGNNLKNVTSPFDGPLVAGGAPRGEAGGGTDIAARGREVLFVASRDPSHSDDDFAATARLLEVQIVYRTTSYSDIPPQSLLVNRTLIEDEDSA